MNLKKLKEILDFTLISEEEKEGLIIQCLAADEKVIPIVMKILDTERNMKKEIIMDMNELISKSEAALDSPNLNKGGFIQKQINSFFERHKETKGVFHAYRQQQ